MRKILIDTHILIWWLSEPSKLKKDHYDLIADSENIIFVSVASFFEIEIKEKIGKLEFRGNFEAILKANGFESLPIALKHLETLRKIEFTHKDPFDMVLIAQAISENIALISYDSQILNVDGLMIF
jgi:PIN domain nuclease of toxin-antitoxin system